MVDFSGNTRLFGRDFSRASLLGLGLLVFNFLAVAALVATYLASPSAMATMLPLAGLSVPIQAALLLLLPSVRAVAKQTFSQCIRMKIAVAFIILLAASLGMVCTQMKGDGTLAGQAKTLLSYGMSVIGLILSAVTVVPAASLIANDVRDKTIFTLASKPLPRWQYVLGRWMGLVLLNMALLAPSMAVVYGASQYLRYQDTIEGNPVTPRDRLAVESEVFASRQSVGPKPIDVEQAFRERVAAITKDTQSFASILQEYKSRIKGDDDAARAAIESDIRQQLLAGMQSASPLPEDFNRDSVEMVLMASQRLPIVLQWQFSGIQKTGAEVRGEGKVWGDPESDKGRNVVNVRVQTTPQLAGQLTYGGPVQINNMMAQVLAVGADTFWARLISDESSRSGIDALSDGKSVRLTVEPTVQVSYKGQVSGGGDDTVRGIWVAVNPSTHYTYIMQQDDPSGVRATMTVPSNAVDDQGKMQLAFVNRSSGGVTILQSDVGVMYRVGSFEMNFIRSGLLVLLQVAFLSALGLLASTFLTFPVACLTTACMVAFALMRSFVRESVTYANQDFWTALGQLALRGSILLPDLARTSPSDALVGGLSLGWGYVGETAFMQIAMRTLLVLVIACAIFHKREVAQVQV